MTQPGKRQGYAIRQILVWALYFDLSLSIFFAFAGIAGLLGLQYNIGYEIRNLALVVISKQTDSLIWLAATISACACSLVLALGTGRGERYANILYSATAIPALGLYFSGQIHAACFTSVLFSLIFVTATTVLAKRLQITSQPGGMFLTCVGLLAILVYIESYALLTQVLSVWFPQPLAASGLALQAQLSEFLFNYSPVLMLVAIFLWILLVPITFVRPRNRVSVLTPAKKTEEHDSRSIKAMSFSMLIAALALAVFVPISPYLNRSTLQMLRGVDILYYYHVLLNTTSLAQLTGQIGTNYSAPYLLLLYAIKTTTRWNPIWAVVTGPVILAIIFTIAAYFLTNEVTGDRVAAGIAALLGASSFHTTIGLYAGIFENWLGMTMVLVFLLLIHNAITKPNRIVLILAVVSSYALLLIHVWTWAITISATTVAALLSLAMLCRNRRNPDLRYSASIFAAVLLFSVLPVLLVYFAVSLDLFPGLRAMIGNAFSLATSMSFARPSNIVPNFAFTVDRYVGALFTYPEIPLLSMLGLLSMARSNIRTAHMFAGLLIVTSVATVLLDPAYQWRILYVIPFEILAAAGAVVLLEMIDWLSKRTRFGAEHGRVIRTLKVLLVVLILVDCGNYALRSAALLPFAS